MIFWSCLLHGLFVDFDPFFLPAFAITIPPCPAYGPFVLKKRLRMADIPFLPFLEMACKALFFRLDCSLASAPAAYTWLFYTRVISISLSLLFFGFADPSPNFFFCSGNRYCVRKSQPPRASHPLDPFYMNCTSFFFLMPRSSSHPYMPYTTPHSGNSCLL